MSTCTVLTGFPGSGKSTLATEMLAKDGNAVRVNRDELRAMLFRDRKWSPASEDFVGNIEKDIITAALEGKRNVIVDNTHLKQSTIANLKVFAQSFGSNFKHIDLNQTVTRQECIRRDAQREGKARVGRGVIDRMALTNKLIDLSIHDKVAVVDIDGTLANLDHRLHYIQSTPKNHDAFFEQVYRDDVYHRIWDAVLALQDSGHTIVILSGRPNSCGHETDEWLNAREFMTEGLPALDHDYLFMRQAGDHRPDDQVKRQLMNWMFDCGLRKDAIKIVLDDRDSVCAVWREMELPLVQVKEGTAIQVTPSAFETFRKLDIPIAGSIAD